MDTRAISFCNAGHNPPLVITDDGITELKGTPGAPIGFMDNDFLTARKPYTNSTGSLPKEAKLLLFTDGLTEAVNIYSAEEQYEEKELSLSIYRHKNKISRNFVHGLYEDLKKFRGGDSFDDDVCVICVDLAGSEN
jgi:serine phosphatase RsbU (regulator of sigma subunit)